MNEVRFMTSGAKKIVIEGCKSTNASEFKKVGESKELGKGSGMQNDSIRLSDAAPYTMIKFVIADGHDDFTSVHAIELN